MVDSGEPLTPPQPRKSPFQETEKIVKLKSQPKARFPFASYTFTLRFLGKAAVSVKVQCHKVVGFEVLETLSSGLHLKTFGRYRVLTLSKVYFLTS